ncbi:MAG TPA: MFS transporter [Frankiaceae bacterium]|nr:MFS transporter [Frankiaceae bacterium]
MASTTIATPRVAATPPTPPTPAPPRRGHHPGIALAVIAASQLMVVLDATIVNIALPSIQTALNFQTADLSWVLNAYTLTFGGLLLLGARVGDILGRRRMFVFGILLFGLSSLLAGLAPSSGLLLAARALQGVGGAIASPTALALIATNFAEGKERNRAFGVFAAVSGSGAAIGLLAGGVLTEYLSWRWVFYVNVPIAIAIALLVPLYLTESERLPGRFDIAGAVTSTFGMSSLVYGFIRAGQDGWSNSLTITAFVAAVVLLTSFVRIELTSAQPITPLHLLKDRNRGGSYLVMLCLAAALFSMFFFLTLFVQEVLGYGPMKAGLAFLPVSATIIVVATYSSRNLLRFGPRPFMIVGGVLTAVGLGWLSQIQADSSYVTGILIPIILFAAGMGNLFVPLTVSAVSNVSAAESGAASGLLNVMQQVGGSLGLSILVTVFSTATSNERKSLVSSGQVMRQSPQDTAAQILTHGISTAFLVSVAFSIIALGVTLFVVRTRKEDVADLDAAPVAA